MSGDIERPDGIGMNNHNQDTERTEERTASPAIESVELPNQVKLPYCLLYTSDAADE